MNIVLKKLILNVVNFWGSLIFKRQYSTEKFLESFFVSFSTSVLKRVFNDFDDVNYKKSINVLVVKYTIPVPGIKPVFIQLLEEENFRIFHNFVNPVCIFKNY